MIMHYVKFNMRYNYIKLYTSNPLRPTASGESIQNKLRKISVSFFYSNVLIKIISLLRNLLLLPVIGSYRG